MYYLDGYENIIKSVYKVSKPYIGEGKVNNLNDLKIAYLKFLKAYRPNLEVNFENNLIIDDKVVEDKLSLAFEKSDLDDLNQSNIIGSGFSKAEKSEKIKLVKSALDELLSINDDFTKIFNLVIHSIFIKKDARVNDERMTHGGSSSGAIGVIWVSCEDKITKDDLIEIFVHELTHTLVFIDELNVKQFNYSEMLKKENYAKSAILLYRRPMDKVVHSIIVGTEILISRDKILPDCSKVQVHPNNSILAENIIAACDSIYDLKNYKRVISPRTEDLVNRCKNYCMNIINRPSENGRVSQYA